MQRQINPETNVIENQASNFIGFSELRKLFAKVNQINR